MQETISSERRTPTIGTIILNYNYGQYVADAIESALAQEPPLDEILVVDDGSTDTSLEVINAYQPRVRVLAKENGGQMSACLAAARAISTEYVHMLDADDYLAAEFVASVKPLLPSGPVKIQFQLMGADAEKNLLGGIFPTYSDGYGAKQMVEDNRVLGFYVCPPTSGNIFKKDALLGLGLDRMDQRDFIDGPPALAIPYVGEVKSLNKPLVHYRVHGKGHSRWDQPDADLLQFEIDWFGRRWAQACKLLNFAQPPFGDAPPLYVLERRLMRTALLGQAGIVSAAQKYVRRLSAAHLSKKQKLMLTSWALGLIMPVAKWRRKLVLARRSPLNRSGGLSRIIRWLLRYRQPAGARLEGSSPQQ